MEMFNVSGYENAENYMIQGAGINSIVTNPFQQVKAMCDDGNREAFVDQGMYYPAANSYGYYCTGFESPGEWKDHMIFGVDGSEIQYAGAQTESLPYVYYTPTYGYAQSPYNPYNPFIPGATSAFNVPYTGLQQQYPLPTFQDPASSPGYFPIAQPDIFPNSSVDPLLGTGVAFATRSDGRASEDGFNSSYEVYNQSFPKPTMRQTSFLTQISGGIRAHVGSSQQSLTHEGVPSGGNVNKASSYGHQTGFASSPLHAVDNLSNENALPHRKQSNVALASNNGLPGFESSATSRTSLDRGFRSMFNVGRNLNDINRNLDMLGEQNRGPRTNNVRHQLAVKAHMTKMGGGNGQEKIVSRNDEYNKDDFSVEYVNAKFFVIKSYSEDDVHKSIKYSVWSSTHHGNKKLQSAYEDAQEISAGKARGCPIFLFFSVNASGQFCGVAEMIGPLDFHKDMDFWQQDKWSGSFNVKWHIIKDVPNSSFRHILLKNNESKPVTNSRDTQEIRSNEGVEMLKIFKEYPLKTSVLDDFIFYESREQIMQEEKARLVSKSFQNPVFVPLPAFSPIEKKDPLVGLQQPNDEKAKEQKDPKVETSTTMQLLSLNSLVSQSGFGGKNAERPTVKTEADIASALKISSLDINQKDDASESSADAAPSLASTVPVDIVTVGSMPVKVNGFAEASGFLTVGTIPLDPRPRALQLDQEGAISAKRGS